MDLKRQRIDILGVLVDDISQKNAVGAILGMVKSGKRGQYVVTVNAEFVMLARRNADFLKILNSADLAVADGGWPVWAKLIFGGKEHDRVTGVDLVEKLCEKSADLAVSVGFLGGFGDVAERVKVRQISQNPGFEVVLAEPGDPSIGYDLRLRDQIRRIGRIDILFVAYGMGQQEFWIERNRKYLNVGVFIGVGGAFDYISTVKKRAPKFLQNAGFEWLWRLMMEPWRAKRMIRVFPMFWILVFLQLLRHLFGKPKSSKSRLC